jgi:two-component system, chemotaxis family, CheB/CheR fusion protein
VDSSEKSDSELSNEPSFVVGIGVSAGGLDAIETFFKGIPVDSPMAFVVVQRLSPDHKSLTVELLTRKTSLPVYKAENDMDVKSGCIYVLPPRMNLSIFQRKLALEDVSYHEGISLPVDHFLQSLARDVGEHSVAVILSGTGCDGASGVRAVREQGGLVLVQNETTAKFYGMPRAATSTGLADFILPPEKMSETLMAWVQHPYAARLEKNKQPITDEANMMRIFEILRSQFKVDFTYYKPSTIMRRIERRIAVTQVPDLDSYVRFLEQSKSPEEIHTLYGELLIGVTSFFRDPEVMETLENEILPDLLEKAANRELRLWVAGCSTGEEAYTMAILCLQVMEKMGITREVKIFATDIEKEAVIKAGLGIYPNSIASDIHPEVLTKYFFNRGEQFQIDRRIREMVVFAQHNLVRDPPFTRVDLVSCRNLLIYLQPKLQKKALEMFNFSLCSGGVLVLGTSETVGEMEEYFEPLDRKARIYKSLGKARQRIELNQVTGDLGAARSIAEIATRPLRTAMREQERLQERLLNSLVDSYVPLGVVVNDQMEVLYILGDLASIFTIPSGRVHNDIIKMTRHEFSIPLATGIQKVLRTGKEQLYTKLKFQENGKTLSLNLRIKLLPGKKQEGLLVAVFFEGMNEENPMIRVPVDEYNIEVETSLRLQELEQELQYTQENVQATIEELEIFNEELQVTNEELLSSNAELQSINEELQSTNEELHTVNTEYHNMSVELVEVRNDLENLLGNSRVGSLILDEDLCIRRFSKQIADVFHLVSSDVGRPFKHLSHQLRNVDVVEMALQLQRGEKIQDQEALAEDNRRFLLRIMPYKVSPHAYAGVVITLIDITSFYEVRQRLEESKKYAADLIRNMPLGLLIFELGVDGELWLRSGNPAARAMTGWNPAKEPGRRFTDFWSGDGGAELKSEVLEALDKKESLVKADVSFKTEDRITYLNLHIFVLSSNQVAIALQDVTANVSSLQSTRSMELRYRQLADQGKALIWTSGTNKLCDYFNSNWVQFTGRSIEQELGVGWLETVHPEDKDRCMDVYISHFDKQKTFSMVYRMLRHDSQYRWIQDDGSPCYDDDGVFTGYIGHCLDITEQMTLDARASASQIKKVEFDTLMWQAKMGAWSWYAPEDNWNLSKELLLLLGHEKHSKNKNFQLNHATLESWMAPDSTLEFLQVMDALRSGENHRTMHIQLLKADQSKLKGQMWLRSVKDALGSVNAVHALVQEA